MSEAQHEGAAAGVEYRASPPVTNDMLNELFGASWSDHAWSDFAPVLSHSLAYICAFQGERLIGFVNLAWDGGIHAFVLDTTVHPDARRRGIGVQLVRRAAQVAQEHGIQWLHVDYEPHLRSFYEQCGFRDTEAGLMRLRGEEKGGV